MTLKEVEELCEETRDENLRLLTKLVNFSNSMFNFLKDNNYLNDFLKSYPECKEVANAKIRK